MNTSSDSCYCDYCNITGQPCWQSEAIGDHRHRLVIDADDIEVGDIIDNCYVYDIGPSATHADCMIVALGRNGAAKACLLEITEQVEVLR